MKFIYSITLAAAAATLLFGCSGAKDGAESGKPLLAVSIEPQRQILEELADGRFEVVAAMPAGANPETYDPPMSTRRKISSAKAYFAIGHLPFEDVISAGLPTINTSLGISPLYGTHSHGAHSHAHNHGEAAEHHSHDHGEADPHVWTSVRNAKAIAYSMLTQLVSADPAHEEEYRQNFSRMIQRYDSIDAAIAQRLEKASAHSFVVWHPSLSYFARDYGLRQIAVGQESKEMPAGRLKEIIDSARGDSARVFFFQKEYDSRQAESVNREIGTRLVNINPLAYDWEEQLLLVADELTK